MLVSKNLHQKSNEVPMKTSHLQPRFHSKARQLSTQLWNGLLRIHLSSNGLLVQFFFWAFLGLQRSLRQQRHNKRNKYGTRLLTFPNKPNCCLKRSLKYDCSRDIINSRSSRYNLPVLNLKLLLFFYFSRRSTTTKTIIEITARVQHALWKCFLNL